jgi:branched-chain amino acid transport system ATP-binding protein
LSDEDGVVLRVENVSKFFGKMAAVDSVSLEVKENEVFGIAGPNGAGKSTLFNIITRIPFPPNQGKVYLEGEMIQSLPPHTICRKGIARTFQIENAFPTLTVLENVFLAASFGCEKKSKGKYRAFERGMMALELVGLADNKDRRAGELSLLNKKSLMIATALAMDPKILLLDEPSAGLNKEEIHDTMALIKKVKHDRGISVVMIEHVMPVLLGLSDRMMILDQGRKLVEGRPQEVVQNESVIEIYLGTGSFKDVDGPCCQ